MCFGEHLQGNLHGAAEFLLGDGTNPYADDHGDDPDDGLPDDDDDDGPTWIPSPSDNKKRAAVLKNQPVTGSPAEQQDQINLKLTWDNTNLTTGPNWVDGVYQWFADIPNKAQTIPEIESIQESLYLLNSAFWLNKKLLGDWDEFGTAVQRMVMLNVCSAAVVQWFRAGTAFTVWLETNFAVIREIHKIAHWLNVLPMEGLSATQYAIMNALRTFARNKDGAFRRELYDPTLQNWHLSFNDDLRAWFAGGTDVTQIPTGQYEYPELDSLGYSYIHEDHYWVINSLYSIILPSVMTISAQHSWEICVDVTLDESLDSQGKTFGFRTAEPDGSESDVNYFREGNNGNSLLPRLWNDSQSYELALFDNIDPFVIINDFEQSVVHDSGTNHDVIASADRFVGRQKLSIKCTVDAGALCKIEYFTVRHSDGAYRLLGGEVLYKSGLSDLNISRFYLYTGITRIWNFDLF